MIFTSIWFPAIILILLLIFRFCPMQLIKQLSLLTINLLVYYLISGKLISVLIIATFFNYFLGRKMSNKLFAKKLLVFGLTANLLLLAYFKYTNFFLNSVSNLFHLPSIYFQIFLPVGISFYIFSSLSYLIDIYRGKYTAENFIEFALYLTFFPKIIAGPIVRPNELIPQFKKLGISSEQIKTAFGLFLLGLFKKLVIADRLSNYLGPVFGQPELFSFTSLWLAALGYSVQLYCDFSGYTDMAVGTSLLLGIRIPENFKSPYGSLSVTEFWRRWHITLSSWLREYLYIPLGGNRISPVRTYFNLFLTMALGGLWHGANWTYVVWGCSHGIALFCERILSGIVRIPKLLKWSLTYLFVTLSWVIFRSPTISVAATYIRRMFDIHTTGINWMFDFLLPVILGLPLIHLIFTLIPNLKISPDNIPRNFYWCALLSLTLAIVFLKSAGSSPFTYLQF